MIFLSLLCLSLNHLTVSHTLPFPDLPRAVDNVEASILDPGSNPDFFGERSIYNIIWSCLVTIFACTWIAVNPNLPAPEDGEARVFARRLAIMGYLLLAPEMVIMWASRQYLAVLEIYQRHQDRGWTKVHAFFLSMGGFMLYEKGQPIRTLIYTEFEELLEQGMIDWPSITEEEINDKSKGDYLSKGVVLLQTAWFIAQCIVRGRYRLAVTELEIVTLAFAAITMVIYSLWWYKPLDIRVPIPVHLKESYTALDRLADKEVLPKTPSLLEKHAHYVDESLQTESSLSSSLERVSSPSPVAIPLSRNLTPGQVQQTGSHLESRQPETHLSEKEGCSAKDNTQPRADTPLTTSPHSDTGTPVPGVQSQGHVARFRAYVLRQQQKHGVWKGTAYVLFVRPFVPFFGAFDDMISCSTLDGKQFRVPTFYSPKVEDDGMCYLLGLLVALTFGGIHCIAWNFHFASLQERWIWRIAAVLVSSLPMTIVIFSAFVDGGDDGYSSRCAEFIDNFITVLLMSFTCIYMIARLSLLILPLIGLRALPPSAYVDLNWTTFIPHI